MSRTSKLQLQSHLTTERESQTLKSPQMTTIRSSQYHIFARDSETRVTAADFLIFALPLRGNLSTLRQTVKISKRPYFMHFSVPRPHFLDSRTTVSKDYQFQNKSTNENLSNCFYGIGCSPIFQHLNRRKTRFQKCLFFMLNS